MLFISFVIGLIILLNTTYSTGLKSYWEFKVEDSFNYNPAFDLDKMYLVDNSLLKEYNINTKKTRTLKKINYINTHKGYNPYIITIQDKVYLFLLEEVICINKDTKKIIWKTPFSINFLIKPQNRGNILIASQLGNPYEIVAMNANNGNIIWRFKLDKDDYDTVVTSFYIKSDNCYIFTALKKLFILDIKNGEIRKKISFPLVIDAVIPHNENILTYSSKMGIGTILVLDIYANVKLQQKIEGNIVTVANNGNKLFIITSEGKIYCLNEKLEVIWNTKINKELINYCFIYKNLLIVFGSKSEIFLLDTIQGAIQQEIILKLKPEHVELLKNLDKLLIFSEGYLKIYNLNDILNFNKV